MQRGILGAAGMLSGERPFSLTKVWTQSFMVVPSPSTSRFKQSLLAFDRAPVCRGSIRNLSRPSSFSVMG